MEYSRNIYDCAIIGGGLAGLCTAIQLADRGKEVVLFEKNIYPFHKVCGEYISMESWGFLQAIGVPLHEWKLPIIKHLGISAPSGFMLEHHLGLGGFGLSRYKLDAFLCQLAISKGVRVLQHCKVKDVQEVGIHFLINSSEGNFSAKTVCGAYGKYVPGFVQASADYAKSPAPGANYVGVKYHIRTDLPADRIELHNFEGGYCGVSRIEEGAYCLCYLTNSENLKANRNSISEMESQILEKNPRLGRFFQASDFVYKQPLVISNIKFHKRQSSVGGMFQAGDAAGTISPLCGNGMSMAMRSSKLLTAHLLRHLEGPLSLRQAAFAYQSDWNAAFSSRIQAGIWLQRLFGKSLWTEVAIRGLSSSPRMVRKLVDMTHGQPF